MFSQLCYCKKCGRLVHQIIEEDPETYKCDFCDSQVFVVPEKYMLDKINFYPEMENKFIEDYIYSNPEFSKKMYKKQLEYQEARKKRWKEEEIREERNRAAAEYLKTHPGAVICPKCGSVSVTPVQYQSAWTGNGYVENLCMKCGYKWTPGMNF